MFTPKYFKYITKNTGRVSKEALDKYGKFLKWKNDGTDTTADIGCGVGDITHNYLLPIMPDSFDKIVGYDISEQMIEYASKYYGSEKLKFELFDIVRDLYSFETSQFDHVVSFFTLLWVKDQRKAISNISKLLKPDGDLIVAFPAWATIFDFLDEVLRSDKWSPYISQYKPVWKSNYNSDNYFKQFKSYLAESGFEQIYMEINLISENYNTYEHFKHLFYAINPVHNLLTTIQQEELFEEFVIFNFNFNTKYPIEGITDPSYSMQIDIISGYASKFL